MARRRMVDPKFWESYHNKRLIFRQRLLFLGLVSQADDEGRIKGDPLYLRSTIFPYDDIPKATIEKDITAINHEGVIRVYRVGEEVYIEIVNWNKYQTISHPTKSNLPAFENGSGIVLESIRNDSTPIESKLSEDKVSKKEGVKTACGFPLPKNPDGDLLQEVMEIWNGFADRNGLERIRKLDKKRKSGIKNRKADQEFNLQEIFDQIQKTPFLLGQNKRKWKVTFDWIFCSEHNYLKILENNYSDNSGKTLEERWEWADEL